MKRILYILALALSIAACTEEIDKSNRYTFTGETIADYVQNRSDRYSCFIYLLKKANLWGLLSTYGQYTLFLPDNDAVEKFIAEKDSIYHTTKDTDSPIWTGVTSPLVEEISDSMATVIARTHLIERNYHTAEFGEGAIGKWNFNDMIITINYKVTDEGFYIMLNNNSAISVTVIIAPTTEKKLMPNARGPSEIAAQTTRIFLAAMAKRCFPVTTNTASSSNTITVITAVISGAKFAYPKGIISK